MAFTETKTTSYGQNLKQSGKGVGFGFILLIAGTILLWWNEGKSVRTTDMIAEAQEKAAHVESIETIDPQLEGKLIHAYGVVTTTDSLCDREFGIGAVAIRLQRNVEYYQWIENEETESKDKVGGKTETKTTFTYEKAWVTSPIDSKEFTNPEYQQSNYVILDIDEQNHEAANVMLGAYKLSAGLVAQYSTRDTLMPHFTSEQIAHWQRVFAEGKNSLAGAAADTTLSADEKKYFHLSGNTIYFGQNELQPEIGDMRVSFSVVRPGRQVSVLAVAAGNSLTHFTSENGETLAMLSMDNATLDQMIAAKESSNATWTWIRRVIGLLIVCAGFKGIFGILGALLKVLPFLANIANFGTKVIGNVLGFVWSLLVIAIAWVAYRPVVAICLVVAIVAIIVFFSQRGKAKANE